MPYGHDDLPDGAVLPPLWEWFVLLGSFAATGARFLVEWHFETAGARARSAVSRLRASAWRDGYGPPS